MTAAATIDLGPTRMRWWRAEGPDGGGCTVKFVFQWTRRHGIGVTEADLEAERRAFDAWMPDHRLTLLHFLSRADGRGGMALVELDEPDGKLLGRAPAIFKPWYEFEIIPVMDIPEAVTIDNEAKAFRQRLVDPAPAPAEDPFGRGFAHE